MFLDCQNVGGSWGHNFLGNWFVALQYRSIHNFVKRLWGRNFERIDPQRPMMISQY